MPSSDQIDWARATVKVTVPVQHTAMETMQELDVPLAQIPVILSTMLAPPSPLVGADDEQEAPDA